MLAIMAFSFYAGVQGIVQERAWTSIRQAAFLSRYVDDPSQSQTGGWVLGNFKPGIGPPNKQFTILQVYFRNTGWAQTESAYTIRCGNVANSMIATSLNRATIPGTDTFPLWGASFVASAAGNNGTYDCYDDEGGYWNQQETAYNLDGTIINVANDVVFQPDLATGMRVFSGSITINEFAPASVLGAGTARVLSLIGGPLYNSQLPINVAIGGPISPEQLVSGGDVWGTSTNDPRGNACVSESLTAALRGPYIGFPVFFPYCPQPGQWIYWPGLLSGPSTSVDNGGAESSATAMTP